MTHVVLHAALANTTAAGSDLSKIDLSAKRLPKKSLLRILGRLHRWIERLKPADRHSSYWGAYDEIKTYTPEETEEKQAFVARFIEAVKPKMLWDVGCNRGDFAFVALKAGADYVVGWDSDQSALEVAFRRAQESRAALTPLYCDATDPTPAQGWAQGERMGWMERAPVNAVLALALVHHLAIIKNVPLSKIVSWLMDLSPTGVVEFVGKEDQHVCEMLRHRTDIFPDYTLECFLSLLERRARIVKRKTLNPSGRELIWFETGGTNP